MSRASPQPREEPRAFAWILELTSKTWAFMLALAVLVAYWSALHAPFVFDDNVRIAQNANLEQLWPIRGHPNRPVLTFSLALNRHFAGDDPAGYRAVNITIHLVSTLLLFGLVRRTLTLPRFSEETRRRASLLAFASALLWGLHPMNTMAVTYLWQRAESMMAMFYLLTFYAFLRSATAPAGRRVPWTILASCSFLLGLGTKEVMVTAVPLLLLFDATFLSSSFRSGYHRHWKAYVPLVLGLAAFLLIGRIEHRATSDSEVSNLQYLASQPGVIAHYLWTILWPVSLCFDHAWPVAESTMQVLPQTLLVVGLLLASLWGSFRKHPVGFLGLWFFLILAPTSSFVVINDLAAEYRVYLPLAAISVGLVMLVERVSGKHTGLAVMAGLIAAASLFHLTRERNEDYMDPTRLWESTLEVAPHNPRAHGHLAAEQLLARRFEAAEHHARRAVQLDPGYDSARANLASALLQLGRKEEALRHFRRYLESSTGMTNARILRITANLLLERGNPEQAQEHLRQAIQLDPGDVAAILGQARASEQLGQYRRAIGHAEQALELEPNNGEAHLITARARARRGELEQALAALQRAGDHPGKAKVAMELEAFDQLRQGKIGLAEERFEALLRAAPEQALGLSQLARRRSVEPLWGERSGIYVHVAEVAASVVARESLRILENLATTYMNAGRVSDAVETSYYKETLRAEREASTDGP